MYAVHRYSQRYQRRVPGIRRQGRVSQGLVQRLDKEGLITFRQWPVRCMSKASTWRAVSAILFHLHHKGSLLAKCDFPTEVMP